MFWDKLQYSTLGIILPGQSREACRLEGFSIDGILDVYLST